MGKLDKGFAVGAVAAALVLGGLLYALYPTSFNPGYASDNGAASTASSTYDGSGAEQATNSAAQDNNTASQDAMDVPTGSASNPQPSPQL